MNTSIENIVYTEFTKKKAFEQLTLAVACSASCRPAHGEVSISESLTRNLGDLRVKVEWYFLLAISIHAISHVTFPAFYFSIVSYMRLLFQLQIQYCFSLTTKQRIIHAFIWN